MWPSVMIHHTNVIFGVTSDIRKFPYSNILDKAQMKIKKKTEFEYMEYAKAIKNEESVEIS